MSLRDAVIDIFGGTIGGVGLVVVGHPFDTLKVRLQTQDAKNPMYSGLMDCVRKTREAEGLAGFYKGVASPLLGQMFLNAWQFGVWGGVKSFVAERENNGGRISTGGYFAAGAITGAAVALLESPVDLFKTQLQTQVFKKDPAFTSFFGCVRHIVSNYGVRGVFQGLPATVLRNFFAVSMYFGFYELTKKHLAEGDEYERGTLATWKLMVAGGIGGFCYWPLIYPIDVVKSAMQADNLVHNRTYPSVFKAMGQMYREGGAKRLMRGFTPCMMRSLPANAVCFTGYELTVRALKGQDAGAAPVAEH